jgi:hypothetical protein
VNNWKKLTNSRNRVRKKSFGGTFCFSNCHIIRLDTGGLSGILKRLLTYGKLFPKWDIRMMVPTGY